jgi:hypothetical protein
MIESWLQYVADEQRPPLSVAVVDEGGVSVRFNRRNDASPVTADAAVLMTRPRTFSLSTTCQCSPHREPREDARL